VRLHRLIPALLLVGCASAPIDPASFGPQPDPERAADAVDQFLRMELRDRTSIRDYAVSGPYLYTDTLRSDAGWHMCVRYNAKNAYGAYVGVQTSSVIIETMNGVLVARAPRLEAVVPVCVGTAMISRDSAKVAQ
jgi:hypothetical protein